MVLGTVLTAVSFPLLLVHDHHLAETGSMAAVGLSVGIAVTPVVPWLALASVKAGATARLREARMVFDKAFRTLGALRAVAFTLPLALRRVRHQYERGASNWLQSNLRFLPHRNIRRATRLLRDNPSCPRCAQSELGSCLWHLVRGWGRVESYAGSVHGPQRKMALRFATPTFAQLV